MVHRMLLLGLGSRLRSSKLNEHTKKRAAIVAPSNNICGLQNFYLSLWRWIAQPNLGLTYMIAREIMAVYAMCKLPLAILSQKRVLCSISAVVYHHKDFPLWFLRNDCTSNANSMVVCARLRICQPKRLPQLGHMGTYDVRAQDLAGSFHANANSNLESFNPNHKMFLAWRATPSH